MGNLRCGECGAFRMVKFGMALATETNKVFMIMGYIWNQIIANRHNMMGIKPSAIFGFRFVANLAMTLSFFSGNITSFCPFAIIIRAFTTSPIWIILTTEDFPSARFTKFRMPSYQDATNQTRMLVGFFILLMSAFIFFTFLFWGRFGAVMTSIDIMTMLASQSIGVARLTAINTGVLVCSFPYAHTSIITALNRNINPHYPKGVGWR